MVLAEVDDFADLLLMLLLVLLVEVLGLFLEAELFDLLSDFWSGFEAEVDLPSGLEVLASERDFSRSRSQWRESIEWARVFISVSVEGLPCWPIISLIRSANPA